MENNQHQNEGRTVSNASFKRQVGLGLGLLVALALTCFFSFRWINAQPREGRMPVPLRKVNEANAKIYNAYFDSTKLVPTYDKAKAVKSPRVNGRAGMTPVDTQTFRIKVARGAGDTLQVAMEDIFLLPKLDIVHDFKCIEGWSEVTHWGGAGFKAFLDKYKLGYNPATGERYKYVGLVTPDKGYYVGIEMAAMLHPQTILAYEMSGAALPVEQGAPVRLIIPVRYGVKNLKRIGTIFFSDERPADYWHERGYDYSGGH